MTLTIDTIPELAGVKPKPVPLDRIRADEDMQPRTVISEDAIRRYKDALKHDPQAPFPPILLADFGETSGWSGEAAYTVIDGFHRYKAHEELRLPRIKALVIKCSRERAEWLAALANMHHGLPLKRGDHRPVFRRYIEASANRHDDGSVKSYREIVQDLGGLRSLGTIHSWMQKDFPKIAAEIAKRDGTLDGPTWKEPTTTYAQRQLKEYALATSRVARMVAKEDQAGREAVLEWSLYLTENLARSIGVEPSRLFEVAQDAGWKAREEEERLLSGPM